MTENLDAAFPIAFTDRSNSKFDGEQMVELGMSVRDYFAAHAMRGVLIAHPEWGKESGVDKKIAQIAYHLADAMMAEREKVLDELLKDTHDDKGNYEPAQE